MARDQAREHARSVMGDEAFNQAEAARMEIARNEPVWDADIAPVFGTVRGDPDAVLSLVMVCAGELPIHADVVARRPAGPAERAREIAVAVGAAIRAVGVAPRRLEVPDEELVPALERELAGRGIAVAYGDSDELAAAMDHALEHADPSSSRGRMTVALTWRETEATPEELAAFHEAAAEFYEAEPWTLDRPALLVDLPPDPMEKPVPGLPEVPERRQWAASIMGGLGQSFGLVLHSQPSDLVNLFASSHASSMFTDSIGFALTVDFDRKGELTRPMQREIAAGRWRIAGPRAYPRLYGVALPGRRVVARDVRTATTALRAVAVFARGGDPLAETGVAVAPFDPDAEEDRRLEWFNQPQAASSIRAEGAGADADPRLGTWDVSLEQLEATKAAEKERIGRFAEWLREQGVPDDEAGIDLANADAWNWTVVSAGSPGAVTEYDLRLFLYDQYVRKTDPTPEAVRALPRSMRRIVQWLEEREGVRYPFAAAVLDELDGIVARAREMDEPLEQTLRMLSYDVYDDLDTRCMLPASRGWPDLMSMEVAQLREELQRRWLLWYDELVRGGMTDFAELEDVLLARQRDWENTPHPRVGGRTPVDVIVDYVRLPR